MRKNCTRAVHSRRVRYLCILVKCVIMCTISAYENNNRTNY